MSDVIDADFEDEIQLPAKTIIDQSGDDIYGEVDEQLQNFYDEADEYEDIRLEIFRKLRGRKGRFTSSNNAYKKFYTASEFPIYLERLQEDLGAGEYTAKFCYMDDNGKKNYKFDGAFWQVNFNIDKTAQIGSQADLMLELEKERSRTERMFQELIHSHNVLSQSLALTKAAKQFEQSPLEMLTQYASFKDKLGDLLPEQKGNLDKIIGAVQSLVPLFTNVDTSSTSTSTAPEKTTTVEEKAKEYQNTLADKLKELTGEKK